MNNDVLALIGILVGAAIAVFGVITTLKARSAQRHELTGQEAELQVLLNALAIDEEERVRIENEVRRLLLECSYVPFRKELIGQQARERYTPAKEDQPVMVEVGREDGSRFDIELDPDSASSISAFLDKVKRAGGERVLTVK